MILVLNNKCNLTKNEFIKYQEQLEKINNKLKIILCPNMLNVSNYKSINNCYLGAQNVSKYEEGAHTGEVSANILKSYGVSFCLVGHSERRENGETIEDTKEKVLRLLEQGIIPILCIGETLEERQDNRYIDVISNEIELVKNYLDKDQINKILIAYEPIWSIGTGVVPQNSEIEEVINSIKQILPNNKIIYGGSVNEDNILSIKECKGIDGLLLGGLSLKPNNLETFIEKL